MVQALYLLGLIAAANTTPLFVTLAFGERYAYPLDGRLRFWDGAPLLGRAKTVRGVLAAIAAATALAPVVGHSPWRGAAIGAAAMVGDLGSSFVKRRLKLEPSSRALGLDHIPESLVPAWLARDWFGLDALEVAALVAVFVVGALLCSKLFYRIGLRERPY